MDNEEEQEQEELEEEQSGLERSSSSSSSTYNKKLLCIEYPGNVISVDKAVDSLGGLSNIGLVAAEPNRRLELRFRPQDIFCKPTCGERHKCSSFLIRVKRKKKRASADPNKPEYKHTTDMVGSVSSCFRFSNLCDFQYLPMERRTVDGPSSSHSKEQGGEEEEEEKGKVDKLVSIYDEVYFKKLVPRSWVDKTSPLFVPPAVFSRMDLPQDYQFRKEAALEKADAAPHNIIGRIRQRRSHHAIFVTYELEKMPERPREIALNQVKLKFIDQERFQAVKALFSDTRPVWSKSALFALTAIPSQRLKFILPALAYYFTTGPWRNLWVRFGYDPRTDSTAGDLQSLDYRVRQQGGARRKVAAKRSYANYLLPYKAVNWSKPRTSLINVASFAAETPAAVAAEPDKPPDLHLFRAGRVPPYRQMFYQYCDIEVEEVQELLKTSRSNRCTERSGWFLPGTEDRVREMMTNLINVQLAKEREEAFPGQQAPDEKEEGSSDEDLESETQSDDDEDTE